MSFSYLPEQETCPTSYLGGQPMLAPVNAHPMTQFSDSQWSNMSELERRLKRDYSTSTQHHADFYQAMNELGNRHTPVQAQVMPSQPSQPKQDKTIVAMTSWCGFSKKAMASHKEYGVQDKVQELYCDKQDKDHPLCKKTKGYPTYYKPNGTVLKRGYPVQDPKGFYTSL